MKPKRGQNPLVNSSWFFSHLGVYVVSVSNNESLFLAMLRALLNDNGNVADVIWYSQRSTTGRYRRDRSGVCCFDAAGSRASELCLASRLMLSVT